MYLKMKTHRFQVMLNQGTCFLSPHFSFLLHHVGFLPFIPFWLQDDYSRLALHASSFSFSVKVSSRTSRRSVIVSHWVLYPSLNQSLSPGRCSALIVWSPCHMLHSELGSKAPPKPQGPRMGLKWKKSFPPTDCF